MPIVHIDLDVIISNARAVVAHCRRAGIAVFGVTKSCCGMPEVARAMLHGGVDGIAEARLENIRRLRRGGVGCPIMLLRIPALSQADEVVQLADISLNSELDVLAALSLAAQRHDRIHQVILMAELGDLREGLCAEQLMSTAAAVLAMPGLKLVGLGANLNCLGGVLPSEHNMNQLLAHAHTLRQRHGLELPYITAGNSGSLPLLLRGAMPAGINHLRIGEAILQGGRDTFFDTPWQAVERGAFTLSAELLELKTKPSVPIGARGVDAFGAMPHFPELGPRLRGIVNLGQQDIAADCVYPTTPGVRVVGASSDHLVLDLTELPLVPRVGQRLTFQMGYGALLRAMTSEYVEKVVLPPRAGY